MLRHGQRATALFPGKEASAIRETVPAPPVRRSFEYANKEVNGKSESVPRDQDPLCLSPTVHFFLHIN